MKRELFLWECDKIKWAGKITNTSRLHLSETAGINRWQHTAALSAFTAFRPIKTSWLLKDTSFLILPWWTDVPDTWEVATVEATNALGRVFVRYTSGNQSSPRIKRHSETLSQNRSKHAKENATKQKSPNLEKLADFTFKNLAAFAIFNILMNLCFMMVTMYIT